MTHRYSLRFETGERQGEVVPIASARFTVGRRPGNSLQIIENSVSGKHAEFVVDAQGIVLRDLGSTNGTRVGHERALEARLEAGAQLLIGNVGMTLVDERAPAPVLPSTPAAQAASDPFGFPAGPGAGAAPDPVAVPGDAPSEKGFQVSSEDLERARKGSKSGLLLVLIVGALVGAAGWYFLRGAGAGEARMAAPVTPVPGNLLGGGYSFEHEGEDPDAAGLAGVASPWTSREGAPAGFLETPSAAVSGAVGLRADLEPGEWALHASEAVRVQLHRILSLGAVLSSDGDTCARLGVELSTVVDEGDEAGTGPGVMTIWSEPVEGRRAQAVTLRVTVPRGYRRARLVLLGSAAGDGTGAGGAVEADDAWLVPESGGGPALTLDEFKFYALGEPATTAALYRVDDLLVSGLRARSTGAETGYGVATWEASVQDDGIELQPVGIDGPTSFILRAEADATEGGVATIGADGYLGHREAFDRTNVSDLLLGGGLNLVRFRFDEPVRVKGRALGRAFQITCDQPDASPVVLQLKFRTELDAAANLARDAEQAEKDGHLGLCLTTWQELLDSYPYDERHVSRAEETRGRLILAGLEEVRAMSAQMERARFFRLIDYYREGLAKTTALAQRYAGSEVEPEARRLASLLAGEIAVLEVDLDRHEKARLEGILRTLEVQHAERLAGQVRGYLAEHFQGAD